ncbi:MAG: phage terminase small subunit P27 family [Oceanicaulis sp.]
MSKGKKPYLVALEGGADAFIPHEAARGDVVKDERLDPPEFMLDDRIAMEEWRRIVPLLSAKGILDKLDVMRLAIYCQAVSEYDQVTRELKQEGFTYTSKGRNGTQRKNRPEVGRRNELIKIIHSCASDFGMSPLARMRLALGEQDDLFDFAKKINGTNG